MPMHGRVLGQLVGHEDAHLVALDHLDGRAGRLAVVAPQVRLHAGRDLAHDRLGDEVELLPVAVLPPRQRPAVQRHDRLIVRPRCGHERRLHCRGGLCRRLRNGGRRRAPRHQAGVQQRQAAACGHEIPTGEGHGTLLAIIAAEFVLTVRSAAQRGYDAAPPHRDLRTPSIATTARGHRGRLRRTRSVVCTAADDRHVQVGLREPEVPPGLNRLHVGENARPRVGQEREDDRSACHCS